MTQPAKSNEPSMEEILASIRRIIADDDTHRSPQPDAEAAAQVAGPAPEPVAVAAPELVQAAEASPFETLDTGDAELPSAAATADTVPASTGAGDEASADILDLTDSMAAPGPAKSTPASIPKSAAARIPEFRTIEGESDVSFAEAMEHTGPRGGLEELPPPLLSRATSAAVDSAFNSLAQTVLVQNARTLEDLVREMLRPLLKSWLDENLPSLVERLVRAEIERVSRGR
jgi:cell pole-organizing protein PopZ